MPNWLSKLLHSRDTAKPSMNLGEVEDATTIAAEASSATTVPPLPLAIGNAAISAPADKYDSHVLQHVVDGLYAKFPHPTDDNAADCEALVPHVLALRDWIVAAEMRTESAMQLLLRAGAYLSSQKRHIEAEALLLEALNIYAVTKPKSGPDLARGLSGLAHSYEAQGLQSVAEALYMEALAMRREIKPVDIWAVIDCLDELAAFYDGHEIGERVRARANWEEAIDLGRNAVPRKPRAVARLSNKLGILLYEVGHYSKACSLFEEALRMRRVALPEGHPEIASSLSNLASLYGALGRHDDAGPLCTEALRIQQATWPEGHPDVATSLSNLAYLYNNQGRHEDAEPMYAEALSMRRATLPDGHLDIAGSLNNLACLYETIGRYDEAESMYKEAVCIQRAALPIGHPDVANSLNNLAYLYSRQNRHEDAESMYTEALIMRRVALPDGHRSIANSLNNLACLYKTQCRYKEAESMYAEALRIQRAALPDGHPDIVNTICNLADLYEALGRHEEAELLMLEAYKIARVSLSELHPTTELYLRNLKQIQAKITKPNNQAEFRIESQSPAVYGFFKQDVDPKGEVHVQLDGAEGEDGRIPNLPLPHIARRKSRRGE